MTQPEEDVRQREAEFFELAKRFRAAEDPREVQRLGEALGRMVFGGKQQ